MKQSTLSVAAIEMLHDYFVSTAWLTWEYNFGYTLFYKGMLDIKKMSKLLSNVE